MDKDINIEDQQLDEADWGSMSKREFKRREMEHELRHEDQHYKRAMASKKAQTSKPAQHQGYFPHKVNYQDREKAKSEGMRWHPEKKTWYHSTKEKSEKSSFPKHVQESVMENKMENIKEALFQEVVKTIELPSDK